MVSSILPWLDFFFKVQDASPKGCSNRNFFIGASPQAPCSAVLKRACSQQVKKFLQHNKEKNQNYNADANPSVI